MNKHAGAMAACLALQPIIALGAETLIQPEVSERNYRFTHAVLAAGSIVVIN